MARLLSTLADSDIPDGVRLVISLDKSEEDCCANIANDFKWEFGQKDVILHEERLGLKSHVLFCGRLSENYQGIIMLEDDLIVSPKFYQYSLRVISQFSDDNRIGGFALYSPRLSETSLLPFTALEDGYDNFYMKIPCSWGQIFLKNQWLNFEKFVAKYNYQGVNQIDLPDNVLKWPDVSSWKKLYFQFLVFDNKYIFYPRISLSSNCGDVGQHFLKNVRVFQVSLLVGELNYNFSSLSQSKSIYDQFQEVDSSIAPSFLGLESLTFDLSGSKRLCQIKSKYLLSIKRCDKPIKKYPLISYPPELGVLLSLECDLSEGNSISLGKVEDFSSDLGIKIEQLEVYDVRKFNEFEYQKGRAKVLNSTRYKIGDLIVSPFRYIKNWF